MSLSRICTLAVIGALAWSCAGAASAACELKEISEFHITMDGNEPLVDASINGHPVRFLVDMGSSNTFITRLGAKTLGLTPHRMSNITFYGVGGGEVPSETIIDDLKIGNTYAHKADMIVLGNGLRSDKFVGLLGRDVLSQADIEFDLANGAMRIFKPKGCDGDQVVYWNKPYSLATIVPENDPNGLKIYVTLNGQKAIASVDTGAYTSVVTTAMAVRAGITPTTETPHGSSSGISGGVVPTSVAIFPTLAIGDEAIKNAKLRIADLYGADVKTTTGTLVAHRVLDASDMLLGADFIRAHRIYVARSQGKVYFSYNGGPIFQTPTLAAPTPAAADPRTPTK